MIYRQIEQGLNELQQLTHYKEIRDLQIKKCLELSKSNIEPLELKGMMKLIATTDDWEKEFENILKDRKEQQEGN